MGQRDTIMEEEAKEISSMKVLNLSSLALKMKEGGCEPKHAVVLFRNWELSYWIASKEMGISALQPQE